MTDGLGLGKDTEVGLAHAQQQRVKGHSIMDVAEAQGGARGGPAAGASVTKLG